MTTTITTAARRIARELNATSPMVRAQFDADGRLLDELEADLIGRRHPDCVVSHTGTKHRPISQRYAQVLLDAHHYAAANQSDTESYHDLHVDYLTDHLDVEGVR